MAERAGEPGMPATVRFDVISLFGEAFDAVTECGVTARAVRQGAYRLQCWNPRDFALDNYRTIDDRPYGGGPGMVMLAEPLDRALEAIIADRAGQPGRVVLLSPQGEPLRQARVEHYARVMQGGEALTLVCGRYEGIDQRWIDARVDEQVSVGDVVVSGGELPAMMLIDAVVRLLPGVLNDARSAVQDSFAAANDGLLDCPHYTRPEQLAGVAVPEVLMSGHHARIEQWRREQSLLATARRRPDILAAVRAAGLLSSRDEAFLKAAGYPAG